MKAIRYVLYSILLFYSSSLWAGKNQAPVPTQTVSLIDLDIISYITDINDVVGSAIRVNSSNPVIVCEPDVTWWNAFNQTMTTTRIAGFHIDAFDAQPGVKYIIPLNLQGCDNEGLELRMSDPVTGDNRFKSRFTFYIEDLDTGKRIYPANYGGCDYARGDGFITSSLPVHAQLVMINNQSISESIQGGVSLETSQSYATQRCSITGRNAL